MAFDSMIERAARALCVAKGYDPDSDDEVGLGDPGTLNWNCFEDDARVVITAMREPTLVILMAMRDTVPIDGHEWEYVDADATEHWRAMIDAALACDPPPR